MFFLEHGISVAILHCIGLGLPAILTIRALVLHQVEGDELTGIKEATQEQHELDH